MTLRTNAREWKAHALSRDNAASSRGAAILERACHALGLLWPKPRTGEDGAGVERIDRTALESMREVACDAGEALSPWWSTGAEAKERCRKRTHVLLRQLQASEEGTLVVVSHSNYLKMLFAEHLLELAHFSYLRRQPSLTHLPLCLMLRWSRRFSRASLLAPPCLAW